MLAVDRERLKRPAESVIVQKRRRDPQQLMDRGDPAWVALYSQDLDDVADKVYTRDIQGRD